MRCGFHSLLLLSTLWSRCSAVTTAGAPSSTTSKAIPLGSLSMQFQSQSAPPDTFVQTLLTTTLNYLDEYFAVYYSNGFQAVTLQVQSSHLESNSNGYGTFAAQITFNGTAELSADSRPTQDQVSNLLAYAFQQQNRQLYLNKLLASSDAYLKHLTYFVISINGFVISDGQQNGVVQNPAANSSGHHRVDWERAVIIAGSAAGGLLVLACCIMVAFCWWNPKDQQPQMGGGDNDTCERGVIGGPGPLTLSPRATSKSHKQDDNNDVDGSTRSPSPVRSLVSQDSSNFTYNPRSKASLESRQSISMIQIDVSHSTIDIEAWKNQNYIISPVTPAPFGTDLSAIECSMPQKKDLSLLDEDDLKENDGSSPHVIVTTTFLTKDTLLDHETRSKQPALLNSGVMSPNQDLSDEEFSAAQSDDSDVIRDLNKLSRQFDKYRGRR